MSRPLCVMDELREQNDAFQKEVERLNRELAEARRERPGCLCSQCELRRDPYPGRHICSNEDCPCYLEAVPASFGCSMGVKAG